MPWTCEDWNTKLYLQWVGARIVLAQDGISRIELQVEDHHRGAAGTQAVNGAILAYLHDVVQGAAIRSMTGDDVKAIATLNLNVSYVSLKKADRVLSGEGRTLRLHRSVAFAESDFRNAAGDVCCRATGTFRIMRKRESAAVQQPA